MRRKVVVGRPSSQVDLLNKLQEINNEERVKELESEVAKLKQVLEMQKVQQNKINEQMMLMQTDNVRGGPRNIGRNDQGYI